MNQRQAVQQQAYTNETEDISLHYKVGRSESKSVRIGLDLSPVNAVGTMGRLAAQPVFLCRAGTNCFILLA
jgi:hypothetical protein